MASVRKRKWTHKGVEKEAWVVDYIDGGGKRRNRTFAKKKDADRFRVTTEGELAGGVHTPRSEDITVRELAELYLRNQEDRLRDGRLTKGSFLNCRNVVVVSIIPYLGAVRCSMLTSQMVEHFYRRMCTEGGLKPVTAKSRIGRLKHMQDYGLKLGHLKRAVVGEAMVELRGIRQEPVRHFTIEEIHKVLDEASNRRPKAHIRTHFYLMCFVHIAAFCGLRLGEIQALTAKSIDFDGSRIHVRHSLTPDDEMKEPKTAAGLRTVWMPEHLSKLLRFWLDNFVVPEKRGLIFRTPAGFKLGSRDFHGSLWKPLLKRAGMVELKPQGWQHFHALRHFAASWMLQANIPAREVSAMLGHARVSTTHDIYNHVIRATTVQHQALQKAADTMFLPAQAAADAAKAQQRLLMH